MKCGRLILADRHLGVLQGSQGLLRDLFDSIVMVADEQSLIEATSDFSPDLVILDLSLSIGQDACLAERLLKCHPGLRLVVVCVHEEPSVADRLLAAGATCFVAKRAIGTDLRPAVRAAIAGNAYVSPTVNAGRSNPHSANPGAGPGLLGDDSRAATDNPTNRFGSANKKPRS